MSDRRRVWCIGFPRMGTTSLCQALKILGWKVIHNPVSLEDFHRCEAAADMLCTLSYRFLDALWPDSLFILNTRPFDSWENSLRKNGFFWDINTNNPCDFAKFDFNGTVDRWVRLFGSVYGDSHKLRESYYRHHDDVQNWFKHKPEQIQVVNIENMGWDNLCGFLGRPVPKISFPWANRNTIGDDVTLGITSADQWNQRT